MEFDQAFWKIAVIKPFFGQDIIENSVVVFFLKTLINTDTGMRNDSFQIIIKREFIQVPEKVPGTADILIIQDFIFTGLFL